MFVALAEKIKAIGGTAFFVGGCVRDEIMGLEPVDFDVALVGVDLEDGLAVLQQFGPVKQVVGDAPVFMVQGNEIAFARREFSEAPGKHGFRFEVGKHITLREDLERRDFTINALAKDILTGTVFDFFGGIDDIKLRRLRAVNLTHFVESPERVFRLASFAARFDFRVDPETASVCWDMRDSFNTIPAEQVWRHIEKMCGKSVNPGAWLQTMALTGWIHKFAALDVLLDVPQDPTWHPEGTVFIHTCHVMSAAAEVADRDGHDRTFMVLAGLLHDIGKKATTEVGADGRIRSPGHAEVGAEMATRFLADIKAPRKLAAKVVEAVKLHMRSAPSTARQARRLVRGLENITLAELAAVVEADHSGRPPLPKGLPQEWADALAVAETLPDVAESGFSPFLKGRHLIALGLHPGREFGAILRAAEEAQIEGAFEDEAGAIEWAKAFLAV